jgi:hypothetical protein
MPERTNGTASKAVEVFGSPWVRIPLLPLVTGARFLGAGAPQGRRSAKRTAFTGIDPTASLATTALRKSLGRSRAEPARRLSQRVDPRQRQQAPRRRSSGSPAARMRTRPRSNHTPHPIVAPSVDLLALGVCRVQHSCSVALRHHQVLAVLSLDQVFAHSTMTPAYRTAGRRSPLTPASAMTSCVAERFEDISPSSANGFGVR